jgi:hypothetical protein
VEESVVVNRFHHVADFVGVAHQQKPLAGAADLRQHVVDPSSLNLLAKVRPPPGYPILNRILDPDRTRQFAQRSDEVENLVSILMTCVQRAILPLVVRWIAYSSPSR